LAVFTLLVIPLSAGAEEWDVSSEHYPIAVPPLPPDAMEEEQSQTFTGVVEWVDLEGGYYALDGYRLIADTEELESCLGHLVRVRGFISAEPSIYMVPAIKVEEVQRIQPGETVSLIGELVYEDLEGGFFAVKGYHLVSELDEGELSKYLGRQVQVRGSITEEVSIFMTKAFSVVWIQPIDEAVDLPVVEVDPLAGLCPVEAVRVLPRRLLVDGKEEEAVRPLQRGDVLMVPLRRIVESAGGKVHWVGASQTIHVALPGRTASFVIGEGEAELNEEGVYYFRRNLIRLARPAQLIGDTTYVSADALSSILGFMARESEPDVLDLVSPGALKERLQTKEPAEKERQTLVGLVVQMDDGEQPRVLLQGGPMASGEPLLVWLYFHEDTKITWAKGEAAQSADLAVGQQISAQLSGPMLTSYPARAGADSIIILSDVSLWCSGRNH